jgi:hypothetical protein
MGHLSRKSVLAVVVVFAVGAAAAVAAVHGGGDHSMRSVQGSGRIWKARVLEGDQFEAGPVLVGHRAVWVEAGRRLLVRSLDSNGRVRTIFSTSSAPGASKGTKWPFSVEEIAAGGGRVAFVVSASECASAPPSNRRCSAIRSEEYGAPLLSVTLFAGRPGAIKPVETWLPPRHQRRFHENCRRPSPIEVGISDDGLVVSEWPCTPPTSGPRMGQHLVLRSFSGHLVRVLARDLQDSTPFVAAGPWAALMEPSPVAGQDDQVQIIRVRTGQTVRRLRKDWRLGLGAVLGRSGTFAEVSGEPTPYRRCGQQHWLGELTVGQIGHHGQRILTKKLGTNWRRGPVGVAVAGDRVAYGRATGRCLTDTQLVITTPGHGSTPIPGLLGNHLAFDGRFAAVVNGDTVQLTTTPG